MITRLTSPRSLAVLRAEGVHAGRGPLRLLVRPDSARPNSARPARFAFAIPRTVGTAVVRNRIRRRLRAIMQELDCERPAGLAGGDHLVRITGPLDSWSHDTLRSTMAELLTTAHSSKARD